jgi:hypothetical protein
MESFFEYVVKPPAGYEKTRRRKRNLIILYLFVGVILPVAVFFIPFVNRLIVPVFFVCVISDIAVFYLTWPKTKPEYEYAVELDEFRLSVIYGGRIRRVLIRTELRKAELIAPNNGMYKNKINDFETVKAILTEAKAVLENVDSFDNDTLFSSLMPLTEKLSYKTGTIMWCVRIAVSGLGATPGGATEIMEVIGKEESLARIAKAFEVL